MNLATHAGNHLLRQQVYEYLRKKLKSDTLKPGNTVRIKQLSEELGISRTPLRDALLQLQTEGFVTFLPQRGILINKVSEIDIQNFYEVLGALDSRGLLTVFACIGPQEVEKMSALNEDMFQQVGNEAYYEYCEDPAYWSCTRWINDRPNVIVSRSFSKIYGMAGMRLGYAIAHQDTVDRLREFIGRNNANQLALAAAIASLADSELIGRSREANSRGKRILHDCLDELGLEYRVISAHLQGELSYREMVRELTLRIRQFAKRQMTYFRGMQRRGIPIRWIGPGDASTIINSV